MALRSIWILILPCSVMTCLACLMYCQFVLEGSDVSPDAHRLPCLLIGHQNRSLCYLSKGIRTVPYVVQLALQCSDLIYAVVRLDSGVPGAPPRRGGSRWKQLGHIQ